LFQALHPPPRPPVLPPAGVRDAFAALVGDGAVHEVYAATAADAPAASGLAAGFAIGRARGRPVVWIAEDRHGAEAGRLHPPGLVEFGLDPGAVVFVRARGVAEALKAAHDAARCRGLGAVLAALWGESARLDLTASRRLALAAAGSGVAVILARAGAAPAPSAAATRWHARALPSRPLAAGAPGRPAFAAALLRHRAGVPPREWHVEWDRDRACFRPRWDAAGRAPLSRPVVSVPAGRSLAGGAGRVLGAG
jgi:protein ImuA